jgi:hypothetical protein
MIIKLLQTISNVFSEDGTLESSISSECYTIQAENTKLLKNIKTGETTRFVVCVNKKSRIKDYIEVEDPKALEKELLETF